MSIVNESKPWWDITSAENALGMASHPLTAASPFAQISRSLFARTPGSSRVGPVARAHGTAYCSRFTVRGNGAAGA
jgi:hypothetical protein